MAVADLGWTPELVRTLLGEIQRQNDTTRQLVRVLGDLHDVAEALRLELRHLRTERERLERFAELEAATANGG